MTTASNDRFTHRLTRGEYRRHTQELATNLSLRELPEEDDRVTPEPLVPPQHSQIARAGILHLSAIMRELNELREGPENDGYGTLRPTRHAYRVTCELLVDAAIAAAKENRQIPAGCVSTDSQGGVRIEWVREQRSVHLVVPSSEEDDGYIYHEVGADYGTEEASASRLAHWLRDIE